MAFLQQVAVVAEDYDEAIDFFVGALDFELVEDSRALTNDGRPKRWVVVRPRGAATGLLLARPMGRGNGPSSGSSSRGGSGWR